MNLEQINNYIDGDLSPKELNAFEESMKNDTALQTEVARQKMLIEGIKSSRHLALKSRLAAIPVSAGMASSTKWMIGTAAILAIALSYVGLKKQQDNRLNTSNSIIVVEQDNTVTDKEGLVVVIEENKTTENTSVISSTEEINSTTTNKQTKVKKENAQVGLNNHTKTDFSDGLDDMIVPDVAPHIDLDGNTETLNLGVADFNKRHIIPTIEQSKHREYSYYHDKLTLYGDFSSNEYLLIDYAKEKKIFMHYDGSFYELQIRRKKKSLEDSRVTDKHLITKLKEEL